MKNLKTIAILSAFLVGSGYAKFPQDVTPQFTMHAHAVCAVDPLAAPTLEANVETPQASRSSPVVETIQSYASSAWSKGWSYLKSSVSSGAQGMRETFGAAKAESEPTPIVPESASPVSPKNRDSANVEPVLGDNTPAPVNIAAKSNVDKSNAAKSNAAQSNAAQSNATQSNATQSNIAEAKKTEASLLVGLTQSTAVRLGAGGTALGSFAVMEFAAQRFLEPIVFEVVTSYVAPCVLSVLGPVGSVAFGPKIFAATRMGIDALHLLSSYNVYSYVMPVVLGTAGLVIGKAIDVAASYWTGTTAAPAV